MDSDDPALKKVARTPDAAPRWAAGTLDIYVNGVLNSGTLRGTIPSSQFNQNVFASTVYETLHPVVRVHPVTGEQIGRAHV